MDFAPIIRLETCSVRRWAAKLDVTQHMRALPHRNVAVAIHTVRDSQAGVSTKLAFEFLILTAVRSGEVRLATWGEMDVEAQGVDGASGAG